MKKSRKKLVVVLLVLLYLILSALLILYVGKPFFRFINDPAQFQAWIDSHGIGGRIVFFLLVVFQVVLAVIPGEPFEIAAGYAFGWLGGTLVCLLGCAVGSVLVFLFVRRYGTRALEFFFPPEKIESMTFLQNSPNLHRWMFLLFLLPGTPKDLLTYVAGLTKIKLSEFLLLSTVARLPSLVSSIVGGSALGDGNYLTAILVFAVTAGISTLGLFIYSKIQQKKTRT